MQARLERARFVKEFELRGVIPNLHAKVELSNDRISKEILEGLVIQPEGLSLEPEITLAGEVSLVRYAHQSDSSTEIIQVLKGCLAVISCGRRETGNDYGHPHAQTLHRLEAHRAVIARTDLEGDITVTSAPDSLTWSFARPASAAALREPGIPAKREAP